MQLLQLSLKAVIYRIGINARFFLRLKPSKKLFAKWYNLVSHIMQFLFKDFSCMNYGYQGDFSPYLEEDDLMEKYCLQLYHYVATGAGLIDLKDKTILEVGCGRGGGASYLARYLYPARITGMDLSQTAITYCKNHHRAANLDFCQGDSEALPFADSSMDVVINLESAHCYPSFPTFLAETRRVLKPGGYFLFADYRYTDQLAIMKNQLAEAKFHQLKQTDITENIVTSLQADSERRDAIIGSSHFPDFVKGPLRHFAGVKGSKMYREFESRRKIYLCYVLQKPV